MTTGKAIEKQGKQHETPQDKQEKLTEKQALQQNFQQDFQDSQELLASEHIVQGYALEQHTSDSLQKVQIQTELSQSQKEISQHAQSIKEYLTLANVGKAVSIVSSAYFGYQAIKKVQSTWDWLRGKDNTDKADKTDKANKATTSENADKKKDDQNNENGEKKITALPSEEEKENANTGSFRSKCKTMTLRLGGGVTIGWLFKKLYIDKKSMKEIYDETIQNKTNLIYIKKNKNEHTQANAEAEISPGTEKETEKQQQEYPQQVDNTAMQGSNNYNNPIHHQTQTGYQTEYNNEEEQSPGLINDLGQGVRFDNTDIAIVDQQKQHDEQAAQILELTQTINNQITDFEKTIAKYSVRRVENIAQSTKDIQRIVYGSDKNPGLFPHLATLQEKLAVFSPINQEEKDRKHNREKTINDLYLLIADSFAFKLNKNLRNIGVAKTLYMPFIQSLVQKNGEKAKEYQLPQEPSIDEVLAHIKDTCSKEEIETISLYIEVYGVEKLIAPPAGKEGNEAVRIFQQSHDALLDAYRPQFFDAIKKIYTERDELSMTEQERKALGHMSDILGAQGMFDINNENKDRWIRIGGSTACVIAGTVVTLGSFGTGSGIGVPIMVGGAAGLGTAVGLSYIEGREYSYSEYAIETVMGAVPFKIAKHFDNLRVAYGVNKAYQLSNSMARRLLLQEGATYVATGVVGDLAKAGVSEYEFDVGYAVASNLGFALFPLTVKQLGNLASKLKKIPRKFRGAGDALTQHVQEELKKIRFMRLLGDKKKAATYRNKLQRTITKERKQYETSIAQAINNKKTIAQNIIAQQQLLEKKGLQNLTKQELQEYNKLQQEYANVSDQLQTLTSLQTNVKQGQHNTMAQTSNYTGPENFHTLHNKTITVGDTSYTIILKENGHISIKKKNGHILSSREVEQISATFHNAVLKKIHTNFEKFSCYMGDVKTKLSDKLGNTWFGSPQGKKIQQLLGKSATRLRNATYGDLWDASQQFRKEKTAKNFLRAALGSTSGGAMIGNSLVLGLSYTQAESAGQIFSDFVRYRMLGMADIAYMFYESGLINSGIDSVKDLRYASDYTGTISLDY